MEMNDQKIIIQKLTDQPSEDSFLYRYVTIDKLIDFLINERLSLTRLSLFEDRLEGITPEHLLLDLGSEKMSKDFSSWMGGIFNYITTNFNPTGRNALNRQRKDFQRFNYANCWFVSDHESIAMWQLYSRLDSVVIKVPYLAVVEKIQNQKFELTSYDHVKIRYGSVQYHKFDDLKSLSKLAVKEEIQGFVKDKSFEHEKEFRLMISVKKKEIKKADYKEWVLDEQVESLNDSLELKSIYLRIINFQEMPFEIIFHPQSSKWHRENMKSIISKYNLKFKIAESSLTKIFN